jgi:hypothetical protein
MEIKFRCDCGQALKVGEDAAGKTGKCPSCGKEIHIPTVEEAQAQPQPVEVISPPVAQPSSQPSADVGLKKAPARPVPKARPSFEKVKTRGREKSAIARFRGKAGIRVKPKGAQGEEEGVAAPPEKKKKQLVLVGVIVALALIGLLVLYYASYKPGAERSKRIQDYKERALEFSGEVASFCASYAEKEAPSAPVAFRNKVNDVKLKFDEGPKATTEGQPEMRRLESYRLMESVLKKLDEALASVQEREQIDQDRELTPESRKEKIDKVNADFQAVIKECSTLATNMDSKIKSLRER